MFCGTHATQPLSTNDSLRKFQPERSCPWILLLAKPESPEAARRQAVCGLLDVPSESSSEEPEVLERERPLSSTSSVAAAGTSYAAREQGTP